jgi:cysteine desulfuration protein SufE
MSAPGSDPLQFDDIAENFGVLDEWEDRYRYVIELGRTLPPLTAADRVDRNKVLGCASQVWLATTVSRGNDHEDGGPRLAFAGDSDAHIVRGLVAIIITIYQGRRAADILNIDAMAKLASVGLDEHLTPQRSNGVAAMIKRIKADATRALAS